MNRHPYDSLRIKLVVPFALLGLLVSALLSATAYFLVADMEQRNIRRMLQFEADSYRHRVKINPGALLPSTTLLSGHLLPTTEFPDIRVPPPGEPEFFEHNQNGRHYVVLAGKAGERAFALLLDTDGTDRVLRDLAWLLGVGIVMMTGLSTLIGTGLADPVVRPINQLLLALSADSPMPDKAPPPGAGFAADEVPNDEIGRLIRALDAFTRRLYGFALRESHFAADVSHELRTPIAVIRGAAEVLLEDSSLPDTARQRLGVIHRQSVRMTGLLEAMLLLAREQSGAVDLATAMPEVVREAVADIQLTLAGRPVEVCSEIISPTLLPVERAMADAVVSNLLRNAAAHTQRGRIIVRLDEDRLEVEDTGVGIARDRFPEIFQRYAKGDDSPGTGLGLSIVARIIDALGWHIHVASVRGEGTRVTVYFHGNGQRTTGIDAKISNRSIS